MYTAHYDLKIKPFQISSDVAFMWLGEKHKEALATLRYGILDNKGFLLLTGDVGTGKTTLINTLIGSLDDDVIMPRFLIRVWINWIFSIISVQLLVLVVTLLVKDSFYQVSPSF